MRDRQYFATIAIREVEAVSHSVESLKARLEEVGSPSARFAHQELETLAQLLAPNEELYSATQGTYRGGLELLCATFKRIVFVDPELVPPALEEFPLESVSSLNYQGGLSSGKLTIYASSSNATINRLPHTEARAFVSTVRSLLTRQDLPAPQRAAAPPVARATADEPKSQRSSIDVLDQLERLAALKERGVLSDEEFAKQKRKILSGP